MIWRTRERRAGRWSIGGGKRCLNCPAKRGCKDAWEFRIVQAQTWVRCTQIKKKKKKGKIRANVKDSLNIWSMDYLRERTCVITKLELHLTPGYLGEAVAQVSFQVAHTGLREWWVQCVFEVSGCMYTQQCVKSSWIVWSVVHLISTCWPKWFTALMEQQSWGVKQASVKTNMKHFWASKQTVPWQKEIYR